MRKLFLLGMLLTVVSAQSASGGNHEDKAQMEMVKTHFANCMMCKNYLPVFDELMPVLQTEFVQLDNGMAMMQTVSDPAKVKLLHQVNGKLTEIAAAAMQLADADAKTKLCPICQEVRKLTHAGAQASTGTTKQGDLFVLTSSDPEVQAKIAAFKDQCEAMMAGGH